MSTSSPALMRLLVCSGLALFASGSLKAQATQSSHEQVQTNADDADQLLVDLSSDTGPVLHGATGWLYGQSAPGIPTVNIIEPLHPQISAQKPDGGQQHPMADASLVAADYRAAGGRLMQIYMQDIYPDWTYNNLGIDEYLGRVETMTRQIAANPDHDLFVYVPFNEPNNNWYADNGPKFTKFMHDWMLVYRKIRSIDPGAKIAGPGFEHFNGDAFETFLTFARDNQVLPDEFTWHELHDDFFTQWYRRVDRYRASERKLGIGPLPIVINEYARDRGDLAVPGSLVQWVTRLEDSKVYGCLAFWTASGTLADLAARVWPNRPTGAWWLYRWYGSMTGNTVRVRAPHPEAVGLQGLAALDTGHRQVRMIFGGTAKPIRLNVQGLEQIAGMKNGVHVSLFRIARSGIEPSAGPDDVIEQNQALSNHQLTLSVPAGAAESAYFLVLTPSVAHPSVAAAPTTEVDSQRLLAVDADFTARAVYSDPLGSKVVLGSNGANKDESVRFVASAPRDGYYSIGLLYSASRQANLQLTLDGEAARSFRLAPHAGADQVTPVQRLFLAAGVHRFRLSLAPSQAARSISLYSLDLQEAAGAIDRYEVSSSDTLLSGTVHAIPSTGPEAKSAVTGIGDGDQNFLEFGHVKAQAPGLYAMTINYANAEQGHKGQVDEKAGISINGALPVSVWFRNTFSEHVFVTTVVTIRLKQGDNRIRFTGATRLALTIANIQIAKEDQPAKELTPRSAGDSRLQ